MASKADVAEVEKAIAEVNKKFGDATVMRMNEAPEQHVDVVSTGSLSLDLALGCGGLPRGRIVEIFGPESSGKTTLALHAIANAQAKGHLCAVVDAEHALDLQYAKALGVRENELYLSQPDFGEQALDVVESLTETGKMAIILIDSVAALVPKAELDGDFGQATMGVHARLMSQAMRKLTATAHRTNTCLIFINQLRMKIGVVFGNPEVTTGGNALKFYASVRLDVRRRDAIKQAETKGEDPMQIGNKTRVKVVKNKLAPPFREAEFEIHYGKGIDKVGDLLNIAIDTEVIKKAGAFFSYGEERLGQGYYKAVTTLTEDPGLRDDITKAVRKALGKP